MRYCPQGDCLGRRSTRVGNNRLLLWARDTSNYPPPNGGANTRDERLAQLETILFLALRPMTSRKLAELAGLADGTKARTLVRTLNRLYDAQGCAYRIEEIAGGFQLMTRAKFAPWLRRLHGAETEVRLSGPAMETLAVVAYRQPILRAEIEAIRGVQSGEMLRQLIERDLVRIAGRSQELGRPLLYGTSKRFLQIFGLKHIEDLPRPAFLQSRQVAAGESATEAETSADISTQSNYSPEAEEETNVKTLTITKDRLEKLANDNPATGTESELYDLPLGQSPIGQIDGEVEEDNFDEDDEDEDEDFDEDEDEEEEEDEDPDDEPWEEVDDEDEDVEDEDNEDEDEDWEDEDWDEDNWDEDNDWDEDEDEEEEKNEDV